MKVALVIFAGAGIYGLIVLTPLLFAEPWLDPRPNRPEDYYGFLGAAWVLQLLYLTIARDPVRFRPIMPLGVLSKASFFATILLLWLGGRSAGPSMVFATIDLALGIAFAFAWLRTR